MKQNPSRLPFRKYHKPNGFYISAIEQKVFYPSNGVLALKTLESGKINFKQIEAARRSIRRNLKKFGNLWIRMFTGFSITKKPLASRMGKEKVIILYEFVH